MPVPSKQPTPAPDPVQPEEEPTQDTSATDLKMTPAEFAELRSEANRITTQDFHLGRFLQVIVSHLGHAHGLDAAAEDARIAKEARVAARDEEDARLEAEAKDRAKMRLAQDAIERTPEEKATLQAARDEEDAQLVTEAEARAEKRAQEDGEASA